MCDDYIPDAQDLKDFEEFETKQDTSFKYIVFSDAGAPVTLKLYPWSAGSPDGAPKYFTRTAIVEILKGIATVVSCEHRRQMLDTLSLFYHEQSDLISELKLVLSDSMTDDEFWYLINETSPRRPYLENAWNCIFGKNTIDNYREMAKRLEADKLLKATIFDNNISDAEIEYARLEMIDVTPEIMRPLYYLRHIGIAGFHDPADVSSDVVDVDLDEFMSRILNYDKSLTVSFRYQFGLLFKYHSSKNTLESVIPSLMSINKLEHYFHVHFTNEFVRHWKRGVLWSTFICDWMPQEKRVYTCTAKKPDNKLTALSFELKTTTEHDDQDVSRCLENLNRLITLLNGKCCTLKSALTDLGLLQHYTILRTHLKDPNSVPHKVTAIGINNVLEPILCKSK